MHRREVTKALMLSAGPVMLASEARAQAACTLPCYPQTAAEVAANVVPTNTQFSASFGIDVRRYMSADQLRDFNAGSLSVNQCTAVQAAISVCAATANWGMLIIPGKLYMDLPSQLPGSPPPTSSVTIDRPVQAMNSEFVIVGIGPEAGFYTNGNITIFGTNLTGSAPQSEFVTFQNIRFESSAQSSLSYVMSQYFLRIKFLHCTFYQIRGVISTFYLQTWKFDACLIKAAPGYFVQAPACYDISFLQCEVGNYGGTSGSLIRIDNGDSSSRGCNGLRILDCLIEGLSTGTAWLTGCSGLMVAGNHIESNAANDFNLWAGGAPLINNSATFIGNYVVNQYGPFIYHGPANNVVSAGNLTTKGGGSATNAGQLHNNAVQVANLTSTGDFADGGVSDAALGLTAGGLLSNGQFGPPSPGGGAQHGRVYQGVGVPGNATGNDGDMYFRTDTPTVASQRIYIKAAGMWTGIV